MTAPQAWLVRNGHPDPERNDLHDRHEQRVQLAQ
jgi:hypothetical protein